MAAWVDRKAVEDVVEQIAACRIINRFYPTIIAKRSGISLDKTFRYLLEFVQQEMLILKWEIRCPEYSCARTVKTVVTIPPDETVIDCDCGETVEVTIDNVFPVFEIAADYRTSCIAEKTQLVKKNNVLTKQMILN